MTVFISYSREDIEIASKLHRDLMKRGVRCWFDKIDLAPGERWRRTIEEAIKKSKYFIALLSSRAVEKRGFVQREIALALDVLDEFPETDVFVVPVRADNCSPSHARLRDLNWVDLFPSYKEGFARLVKILADEISDDEMRNYNLTVRELAVLRLLERPYKEIASELMIAKTTVASHVHRILRKLGVRSRSEALMVAVSMGLIKPRGLDKQRAKPKKQT